MGTGDVEPDRPDRRHKENTRAVRSRVVEPLENDVPLLHAVVPVEHLDLDSGIAEDLVREVNKRLSAVVPMRIV